YLDNHEQLEQFNLVNNGGFENPLGIKGWQSFGGAGFSREKAARHTGRYGIELNLPKGGSAFSTDAIHTCSPRLGGRIFTFTIEARTETSGELVSRMIFKDADGNILQIYNSEPHPGD